MFTLSFGGGGTSAIGNHVHDNNPGEGGALSKTLTLMGADILFDLITNATDPQTAINTGNIATNVTNIATNTSNIATNTGSIATNTSNIATNTGSISTNTSDIGTNATAIAGLVSNKGKWSATNVATFKTSVIAGAQAGTIEEVT